MTKTEIEDQIIAAEDDARRATARDILIELRDFLDDPKAITGAERAGLKAAIEIIEANFSH